MGSNLGYVVYYSPAFVYFWRDLMSSFVSVKRLETNAGERCGGCP
jgi:hypothetical protein